MVLVLNNLLISLKLGSRYQRLWNEKNPLIKTLISCKILFKFSNLLCNKANLKTKIDYFKQK